MLEYADELLQGIRRCMLACGAKSAVIGIEKNKPEAISLLSAKCGEGISVRALRTRYPQGAEKQLICGCTGRVVPEGKLPIENCRSTRASWSSTYTRRCPSIARSI